MSYFESRLKINLENINEIKKKLEFCDKLGIKNLILEPLKNVKEISIDLKERIKKDTKINIYYRINLSPKNLDDFKKTIKNYNHFPEILSVESLSREVQIHAARDSRIDILSYSNQNIIKTITPGVISLVKQNNSFIEFSLASLMIKNKSIQSKNFRNLFHFIQLVRKLKANYILSGNFDTLYDFRHPRALISICYSLLEIPLVELKKAFRDNLRTLLNRVQKRQDQRIFEEGVRIIRGEE